MRLEEANEYTIDGYDQWAQSRGRPAHDALTTQADVNKHVGDYLDMRDEYDEWAQSRGRPTHDALTTQADVNKHVGDYLDMREAIKASDADVAAPPPGADSTVPGPQGEPAGADSTVPGPQGEQEVPASSVPGLHNLKRTNLAHIDVALYNHPVSENKIEPTGDYRRATRLNHNMLCPMPLVKQTGAAFVAKENKDVAPDLAERLRDDRDQAKAIIDRDLRDNLNGLRPACTGEVTRAPWGMKITGGHFMPRAVARLAPSMRHEVNQKGPREMYGASEAAGHSLRSQVRVTTNKTEEGRVGNVESSVEQQSLRKRMSVDSRRCATAVRRNPLLDLDGRGGLRGRGKALRDNEKRSMANVRDAVAENLTGQGAYQRGETMETKDRTHGVDRKQHVGFDDDVATVSRGKELKRTTDRGLLRQTRVDVEDALTNGIVLRRPNPCLKSRITRVQRDMPANESTLSMATTEPGKVSSQRNNFGQHLREDTGTGDLFSTSLGAAEHTADRTAEAQCGYGTFEGKVDVSFQRPETQSSCVVDLPAPVNMAVATTTKVLYPAASTKGDANYYPM